MRGDARLYQVSPTADEDALLRLLARCVGPAGREEA